MKFSREEEATIIHSLRLFQEEQRPKYGQYGVPRSFASRIFDETRPLDGSEIEGLIAKIQTSK